MRVRRGRRERVSEGRARERGSGERKEEKKKKKKKNKKKKKKKEAQSSRTVAPAVISPPCPCTLRCLTSFLSVSGQTERENPDST